MGQTEVAPAGLLSVLNCELRGPLRPGTLQDAKLRSFVLPHLEQLQASGLDNCPEAVYCPLSSGDGHHVYIHGGTRVAWRVCQDLLYDKQAAVRSHGVRDVLQDADTLAVAVVVEAAAQIVDEGS